VARGPGGIRAVVGRGTGGVQIDLPVRDYLDQLMALDYLPRRLSAALGPVNRFLTAGFLSRRSARRCR
jgi:hypothetical protein